MQISILTPSYNTSKYLQRAIDSVTSQSYTNWEHIVVDGASTDNTIEILKGNPHLKWISEPDKGQSDAMNKAFSMSTGDIIVYLNADDYFHAEAFATVLDAFNKNKGANFVVGNLERITINPASNTISERNIIEPHYTYKNILHNYRGGHFPYNPVCYFYKREIQQRVGGFPIENHYAMDLFFLLRALQIAKPIKVNQVLGTFWTDGANKTANSNCASVNYQTIKQHCKQFNRTGFIAYKAGQFQHLYIWPVWVKTKIVLHPVYKLLFGKVKIC